MNRIRLFLYSSFLVALLLTLVSFKAISQEGGEKEFAVVRVFEPVEAKGEIVITYGNEKSERISIEQLNSSNHENNGNTLVGVFNELSKAGYEMETGGSSGSGNTASLVHVSTFVFSREKP